MDLLERRDVVRMMLGRAVGHRPELFDWGCFTGRHCWRLHSRGSGQINWVFGRLVVLDTISGGWVSDVRQLLSQSLLSRCQERFWRWGLSWEPETRVWEGLVSEGSMKKKENDVDPTKAARKITSSPQGMQASRDNDRVVWIVTCGEACSCQVILENKYVPEVGAGIYSQWCCEGAGHFEWKFLKFLQAFQGSLLEGLCGLNGGEEVGMQGRTT